MDYRRSTTVIIVMLCLYGKMGDARPDGYHDCRSVVEKGVSMLTDCCKRPEGMKDSPEVIAIKKDCGQVVMGDRQMPGKPEDRLSIFECLDECFFNATMQFTDLKPNEEAIIGILQEEFKKYPHWNESVVKAVKACVNSDYLTRLREGAQCKGAAIQLEECLGKQMYLNCPKEAWQNNRLECNNAKEVYVKCTPYI